jgi:anti-sigma factor RsiW
MRDEDADRDFVDRELRRLPQPDLSSGFEAALMAGYDAWNAERKKSARAVKAGLRGFSDMIWPGAPLWVPASALAAALLVGAGVGAALPAAEQSGFSLEQAGSFTLFASDMTDEEAL